MFKCKLQKLVCLFGPKNMYFCTIPEGPDNEVGGMALCTFGFCTIIVGIFVLFATTPTLLFGITIILVAVALFIIGLILYNKKQKQPLE